MSNNNNLHLPEDVLLTIFEKSAGSLIIRADAPRFTMLAVSDAYLELTQLKREDIVGKGVFEVFTDNEDDPSGALSARRAFAEVIATRKAVDIPVYKYDIPVGRTGKLEPFYWSNSNVPILGADGEVAFILNTTTNITGRVLLEQKEAASRKNLEEEQNRFRDLVLQAPFAIGILRGEDMVIELANDGILELWGKTSNVVGKTIAAALPELVGQPYLDLLKNVYNTGVANYGYEALAVINRNGVDSPYYFNYVYHPITEADGVIAGIMVVASEVTGQVKARQALERSEKQFRDLVTKSPIAMAVLRGRDMVVELFNEQLLQLWSKSASDVQSRKLLNILPELVGQPFPQLLENVFDTGQAYAQDEEELFLNTPEGVLKYYVSFRYEPLFDDEGNTSGIMVTAQNITDQVVNRRLLEDAEERLRLAAEATGFGTWDINLLTGQLIYSPRLAEIFGRKNNDQLTHYELRHIVHPDDLDSIVMKAYYSALKTGVYFYEARILWPDGSMHWIRTQGKVIFDIDHKPTRMLGTTMDITSQRQVINDLRESEENLRLATSAAELGTFDWNIKEDKLYWDDRCRELFGLPAGAPVTYVQTFISGLHPDDREVTVQAVNNALDQKRSGGYYDVEYRTIGIADKKLRWVKAKGKAFFNAKGEPLRLIGSVLDITERMQDEIRKNDFIAMASHELKTPLTSLKAYVQMLLANARKNNNEFFANSLAKADNQINKMTSLIYGFLDLSKIESGRLQLNKTIFDINELINEVIADMLPIAQSHHISFEHSGPVMVEADREKIHQVITNFSSNAVKYSDKGKQVTISVSTNDLMAVIRVKDEGIGIRSEDQKNIFERFYRVENEQTKGFSGFGIGLYISAEIIKLHKGHIGVNSEEGEGSTFYFSLPLA